MKDDERLPWFPCEPSKLLGALSAMKPHVGYTYWIVCLRVYEIGGPCPDSLEAIARRTGYNKRVVSDALDVLFRAGKLVREADGIMNPYAAQVLDGIRVRKGRASQSGREGANRRWQKPKPNQDSHDSEPIQTPMGFDADLDLQLDKGSKEGRDPPAKRRAPRAMIRDDWTPTGKDVAYATDLGFDGRTIERMARAFVNHHRSRGTMIAKLDATWRTWCDNEVKFAADRAARQAPRNGSPSMFEIATGHHREETR